uniref:Uncharacterized protein n=1 Tax=Frankia torreyi TaxID=1856 RepID=Q9AEZ4_9ACTN|nr:hypothetical protein [Frankia torreyi]
MTTAPAGGMPDRGRIGVGQSRQTASRCAATSGAVRISAAVARMAWARRLVSAGSRASAPSRIRAWAWRVATSWSAWAAARRCSRVGRVIGPPTGGCDQCAVVSRINAAPGAGGCQERRPRGIRTRR